MRLRTKAGRVKGSAPRGRVAVIAGLAVVALLVPGSVDAGAAGCPRPTGVKVTGKTLASFSCATKEYRGLIVTYHKELADELEGCPPPPGPNQWQILDETSAANAEYGATIEIHVRLGFEALALYVVATYKRHYSFRKEELQLTQAASYYKAVGSAWASAVGDLRGGFSAVQGHECSPASVKENDGSTELEKGTTALGKAEALMAEVKKGV
jgi:hypothetical protein